METFSAYFDFPANNIPYFRELLVFLVSSLAIVPVFQRLKASPVLGYLAVGIIVGPFGFELVHESPGLEMLADLGVVFLLFMIGLKLSLERLRAMRRYVLGLGVLQVLVTAALVGGVAYSWDNTLESSILLGLCFALSSTAIVSQMLMEKNELLSHKGRIALSVLLAQDLAIVPLLVLVNVFSGGGEQTIGQELAIAATKATACILVIIFAGRLVLRPIFRMINAQSQSPELFVGLSLLVILVTAAFTSAAGLSMELGAFMAGLMLAETEFHNRIEIDIKPFQGLLLGLFFITVGMGIDIHAVMDNLFWLSASVVGIFIMKAAVIAVIGTAFGIERKVILPASLLLGQGGEFVFVVVGAAMASHLIDGPVGHFMLLVTALSMIATPLFVVLSDRLEKKLEQHPS